MFNSLNMENSIYLIIEDNVSLEIIDRLKKKINLIENDIDFSNLILFIAESTQVNFINQVKDDFKISIEVRNMNLEEILSFLGKKYNLFFFCRSNFIMVNSINDIYVDFYQLRYFFNENIGDLPVLDTRSFNNKDPFNSNLWDEIKKVLIFCSKDENNFVIDRRSGTIILRASVINHFIFKKHLDSLNQSLNKNIKADLFIFELETKEKKEDFFFLDELIKNLFLSKEKISDLSKILLEKIPKYIEMNSIINSKIEILNNNIFYLSSFNDNLEISEENKNNKKQKNIKIVSVGGFSVSMCFTIVNNDSSLLKLRIVDKRNSIGNKLKDSEVFVTRLVERNKPILISCFSETSSEDISLLKQKQKQDYKKELFICISIDF